MNSTNLALGVWKLKQWLKKSKIDRKIGAEKALYLIEKELDDDNIQVIDITGKQYDPGLAVEVINNLAPEEKDTSKIIIIEMIKPIVMKDNQVLSFGQVVIGNAIPLVTETKTVNLTESPISPKPIRSSWDLIYKLISLLLILFLVLTLINLNLEIENQSLLIQNHNDLINDLSDQNEVIMNNLKEVTNQNLSLLVKVDSMQSDLEKSVVFDIYTVKKGDSLISICESFGIDYYANKGIILSMNGISNPSHITTGQKILIVRKVEK